MMRINSNIGIILGAGLLCGLTAGLSYAQEQMEEPMAAPVGIELSKGPVKGGPRVIGLGGAYTSLAEGLVGVPYNPAAMGNRDNRDRSFFAWDLAVGYSFLPLERTDYENDGIASDAIRSQRIINLGVQVQFGYLGIAWNYTDRLYEVRANKEREVDFSFGEHLLGAGFQIPSLGLALGAAAVFESTEIFLDNVNLVFDENLAEQELTSTGYAIGLLYRPVHMPFRAGLSVRNVPDQATGPIEGREQLVDKDVLAESVSSPTEVRAGFSWMFGRPYNPASAVPSITDTNLYRTYISKQTPLPPNTEPKPVLPRYILLSLDLLALAPNGVDDYNIMGPEGFAERARCQLETGAPRGSDERRRCLNARDETAGKNWSVGYHAGLESEAITRWLKIRLGSYFEPSRFKGVDGRVHVTGGFDVHFPHIWAVQYGVDNWGWNKTLPKKLDLPLTAKIFADYARDYFSLGFSVGVWK